jgi:hypothetical protein
MTACPGMRCPVKDNCQRYVIHILEGVTTTVDPVRREDGSCGFFWRVPISEGDDAN